MPVRGSRFAGRRTPRTAHRTPMDLYPAIDIMGGQVVRASRTNPSQRTLYHEDPFAVADRYAAAGAPWVHVVDLDRAFGLGDQAQLVGAIVRRLPIPVQLGGGLWELGDVTLMRDLGVQRVVLGVHALADREALRELVDIFSEDCLAMAIDTDQGRGWSRDWPDAASYEPAGLAKQAVAAGIRTLVHTDLAREGALIGANVAAARSLADASGGHVIVSGGVTSLDDLAAIRDAGLAGAVIGRALFEHRFSLEDALLCCSSS